MNQGSEEECKLKNEKVAIGMARNAFASFGEWRGNAAGGGWQTEMLER